MRSVCRSVLTSIRFCGLCGLVLWPLAGCQQGTPRNFFASGGSGGGTPITTPIDGTQTAQAIVSLSAGTQQDESALVTLRVDQTLKLRLAFDPNSGVSWRLDPAQSTTFAAADSPIHIGGRKIEQGTATPGSALGTAVFDVFHIAAMHPTDTSLPEGVSVRFLLDNGQLNSKPVNTFTAQITIK